MTTPELQPAAETVLHTLRKRKSNWGFGVWLACSWLLTLVVVGVGSAWAVRHSLTSGQRLSDAQQEAALAVASLPGTARDAVHEFMWQFSDDPKSLLMERASTEKPYWERKFPQNTDSGYLLFSGISPKYKQSIIELIRIADGAIVSTWYPDWNYIYDNIQDQKYEKKGSIKNAVASNPVMLNDGDVVFNTNTALIRMSRCDRKPKWILASTIHHSINLDVAGNIWSPSVAANGFKGHAWLQDNIRDDSLAQISPDGKILQNISFSDVLISNGLQSLLLGTKGFIINTDPVHLNQIQPALYSTKYWEKGDLLISSRHLSTVFIYRPSNGKIVWHQTGPWMNQHSARFHNNNSITVFDNNIISFAPKNREFLSSDETNQVYIHDFQTKKSIKSHERLLSQTGIRTITGGSARLLPDGGLFVDESNTGRLVRYNSNSVSWSRINDYGKDTIGAGGGSSYLTAAEIRVPMAAIQSHKCPTPASQ